MEIRIEDIILFGLLCISILFMLIIVISINQELLDQKTIGANCTFENGLKDIKIKQLEKEIEDYKYNSTQFEINYWKEKYYEKEGIE